MCVVNNGTPDEPTTAATSTTTSTTAATSTTTAATTTVVVRLPTTTVARTTTTARPLFPDGSTEASDELAIRYIDSSDGSFDCEYYDRCVNIEIYAIQSCDGGYIEANVLDSNGTIVDFSNDVIPQMRPTDKYRSVLGTFGSSTGRRYRITELICY